MSVQEKHCDVCGTTHRVESTREIRPEPGSVPCPNCGAPIHSWRMGMKWRLTKTDESPLPNNYLPYPPRNRPLAARNKQSAGEQADYDKAQ